RSGTSGPLCSMSSAVATIGMSRARATRMSQAMRCTSGPRSWSGSLSRKYCCTSTTIRQDRSRSIRPPAVCAIDLVLRRPGAAQLLDPRAPGLGLEAPALRTQGRFGLVARPGRLGRATDEIDELLARLLAVALLGAVALGDDDEHALVGETPARQVLEPLTHGREQRGRMTDVETQLRRRRQLVDVLAAGAGRADEILFDFALVEADAVG